MSGGYRNAALDSPGKRNTRSKYSAIIQSTEPVVHIAPVIAHGPLLHHHHAGGFSNAGLESPGKYSSRVKYTSIRPTSVHESRSSAPIMAHAHPIKGGYYNLPSESPGKYSSRVKYTCILHGAGVYASGAAAPASFVSAASPKAAPAVQSSRSSSAGPSQAQIDAVQKHMYGGAYTCILQVVKARTSDPEQNYFQDEFDGEGLNIDEAAVRKMIQSLPAPLVLQSVQNKGKAELKFVVQNSATKLSSDFIITYKGGDIGEFCASDVSAPCIAACAQ